MQESKLELVSRPRKVARGTSEVARGTCGAGKKVISHGIADPARLQEAQARWLGELAVQEKSKLARVSGSGKVARGSNEVARRTCDARKQTRTSSPTPQGCKRHERDGSANMRCMKGNSLGLADLARFQGHERGGSANLRCRKVSSRGLADQARWPEAWARWLGELTRQESKIARISRLGKVASAKCVVAQ
ncbi:hypothetical protein CRG98_044536 [Punica granatum]|uniref:Uncharacterized protein n=1 Tax=Punica granatum TaxID=22663 RepID=A0A2I0HTN5_PUNGR|nr:hypothetical protein CRG98_044536 [Punica granatum]